ncbi:protein nervous wreck [Anabrus simplex]|uniref:protein nervous wreck n=1 Tax=Anabrus simplex TaxID=316456 RepID=UPI0035A2D0AB
MSVQRKIRSKPRRLYGLSGGVGTYTKFLKTLHSEQVAKLQSKNQHECDLLEDIRNYTLKRSAIEKSYSEALLKISSAFLNKKIPNIPDIKTEGGEEKWNMWNVWRTVLEENEKLARARLAAVEVFHQQIADDAKVLRAQKVSASKKCADQLQVVQKELQVTVQDVDKTKKLYFDEEHSAHDVRDKAKDIEEKLKKKKGSFFQSITSLQKNSAKVTSKREALEEKSTGARNDYLLSLAAANAHQRRYFLVDLQNTMLTMENNVFDKVAEYLTLIGRTELLTCSATQTSFTRIRDQAQQLTREYNLQCCYLYYPVLKQHIQYDFEPCENDTIDKVTADHPSAAQTLSKEARRWATRMSRETNNIRENTRKMLAFQQMRDSGQKTDPNDINGPDLETKIEELRQAVRRSETAKTKAEARLEALRAGGINVDEFLQDADNLSVQDIPRSASSLSVRTDASGTGEPPGSDSFYDSDFDGSSEVTQVERPVSVSDVRDEEAEREQAAEVDAMVEQERQRLEQLTAGWDDPTQADWGLEDSEASAAQDTVNTNTDSVQTVVIAPTEPGKTYKCVALYNYTAQNSDELSIVENEQLEVVGEGDGDGWLRARNYRGEEGYVPHNYLDVDRDQQDWATSSQGGGSSYQLVSQISFSSVDYTVDEQDDIEGMPASTEASPAHQKVEGEESIESFCMALYDYEAACSEELTFTEGQIIRVLSKVPHQVDDGWWEGEVEGRTGLFPSLVVEECREDGQPLTPQDEDEPPSSAPPVFTPPDVPSFLCAPQHVIITQPTPEIEHVQPPIEKAQGNDTAPKNSGEPAFAMELRRDLQDHYETQFDEAPNVTVVDVDEAVPSVTVVLDEEFVEDNAKPGGDSEEQEPPFAAPPKPVPPLIAGDGDAFGLGVAQIVITAATPMIEEPEQPFPPPPTEEEQAAAGKTADPEVAEEEEKAVQEEEEAKVQEEEEPPGYEEASVGPESRVDDPADIEDDLPTDSAPFPISSSTGSEEDTYTGPSTAENSQSQPPPSAARPQAPSQPDPPPAEPEVVEEQKSPVVGGRGSIPDELEPHQLAKLQDLKESNA